MLEGRSSSHIIYANRIFHSKAAAIRRALDDREHA